jgi:hypothetical protein
VTVMLATDHVALYEAGEADAHGWRLPPPADAEPYWQGAGALQRSPGASDPAASAGGGHGPHDPAAYATAVLYLPADAMPLEGSLALIGDELFVLSQTRLVNDPAAPYHGGLTCWTATATEARGG